MKDQFAQFNDVAEVGEVRMYLRRQLWHGQRLAAKWCMRHVESGGCDKYFTHQILARSVADAAVQQFALLRFGMADKFFNRFYVQARGHHQRK